MKIRKWIVAGLVMLMLASLAGIASAQGPDGPGGGRRGPNPRQNRPGARIAIRLMESVAEQIGIEPEELIEGLRDGQTPAEIIEANGGSVDEVTAALIEEITAKVETALEEGNLTQAAADRILENLQEHVTSAINGELRATLGFAFGPNFGDQFGPGFGFGFHQMPGRGNLPGGPNQLPFGQRPVIGAVREGIGQAVQEATGLTGPEIREAMADGGTLADLLEANDVDVEAFKEDVTAQFEERLQQALENGRIDEEQMQELLERFSERLEDLLNTARM